MGIHGACGALCCSEPYLGLRGLWLDGNGIRELTGLSHLFNLRSLHMPQNALTRIGDGLAGLTNLMTLNVANNQIAHLDGAFVLRCL